MMNKENLNLLLTVLEEIELSETAKFDLGEWFEIPLELNDKYKNLNRDIHDHTPVTITPMDAIKCGTIACIAGHAALDQRFIDKGLHLEFKPVKTDNKKFMPSAYICYTAPSGKTFQGETALELFFGLPGTLTSLYFGLSMFAAHVYGRASIEDVKIYDVIPTLKGLMEASDPFEYTREILEKNVPSSEHVYIQSAMTNSF